MKKIMIIALILTITVVSYSANAATYGCIDVQKVFSSYEKTKKMQDQLKKKEQLIQTDLEKKQKQFEKEKAKNISDADLRKLAEKFQKELEPQRNDLIESEKTMIKEIQDDIVKASEEVSKKMGLEIVLDKSIIFTGGTDITSEVIKQLNK